MMDFKTEDLVLLHLEGFEEYRYEDEVPYGLTPRGITKAVGITESAPYSTLEKIKKDGIIEEKVKNIIGQDRERNVFFLTGKGNKKFQQVWEQIKDEEIILVSEQDEKEIPLKELEKHISGRNPIAKGLRNLDENNIIDISDIEDDFEVFVGRENELQKMKNSLKRVKKKGSELILIEGVAGIGKTSLVSKLMPFAKELGYEFLIGTCQSETSDPYLPFKEAFNRYIEAEKAKEKTGSMAFIGAEQEEETIKDKKLFDARKKETFYQTTKHVREIAQKNPLVVFLDDLQWVDKATLDILAYMSDKLEDESILFIGSYRPEDVSDDHHLSKMMHRFEKESNLRKIKLKPLTKEATKETMTGILGTEDVPARFVEKIHKKTEGNPLFIKECVRQLQEEGILDVEKGRYPERSDEVSMSEMVYNVIERRVKRLDDKTVKVIEIGSVIGETIPFDLLAETADMDEIDLLDHVDMLIGNQLWDETPDEEKFHFSHELIRDTVYKNIKRLKKKLLHKRVANNIEELYEYELEKWYTDLGRNHELAENHSQALDYYLKAGEKAEKVFANEDAVDSYEKALALSDNIDDTEIDQLEIIEKIAKAQTLLGNYDKTRNYLNRALDLISDKKEKQRVLRKISKTYHLQGKWDEAFEYIDKGLSCVEEENVETCKLLSLKGWGYVQRGLYEEGEEIFEKERKIAESLDSKEEMGQVYHDLGTTALRKGDIDEGIEMLEKAVEIRKDIDDKLELQKSLNNLGIAYSDKGDHEKAEENYKKSFELCEDIGDKSGISASLNNLGTIQNKKGELDKAIQTFKESLKMSEMIGDDHGKAISLTNLASLYVMRGKLDKAKEALDETSKIREKSEDKHGKSIDLSIESNIKKKGGKLNEALEKLEESRNIAEKIDSKRNIAIANHEIGNIYLLKGDFDKAETYQKTANNIAEEIGAKDIESFTRDALAKIKNKQGNLNGALEDHAKGLEVAEEADDEEMMIINLIGLGEDKLKIGEINESLEYYHKADEKVKERDDPDLSIRNKLLKVRYDIKKENLEEAEIGVQKVIQESRNVKDKIWEAKSMYESGVIMSLKGEKDISNNRLKKSLDMFKDMGMEWWIKKTEDSLLEV